MLEFLNKFFPPAQNQPPPNNLNPHPIPGSQKYGPQKAGRRRTSVPGPPYSHLSEQEKWDLFEIWMIENNRAYKNESEKNHRFEIFKESMMFIESVCTPAPKGRCPFGLTRVSDIKREELLRKIRQNGCCGPLDV